MKIAYFITQHGYGHAVRSAQVINALPRHIDVLIISAVEKDFFQRMITRDYAYREKAFDVGCVQTSSLTVDIKKTLEAYSATHRKNKESLQDETIFLKTNGVDLIVTDSAAFPLVLSESAGIPGILLASFTWAEIYRPYVEQHPDFEWVIDTMSQEYDKATLHLRPPLSLDINYGKRLVEIPLIAPKGKDIRNDLYSSIGIPPSQHLAILYLGSYGLEVSVDSLAQYRDWHFVTFEPPAFEYPNYTVLDRESWRYEDVMASSDAVIAKLGYGLLSTCMAAGVPVLYPGRKDFVEHAALDRAAKEWGGGISVPDEEFYALNLGAGLAKAIKEKPKTIPSDGAETAARIIKTLTAGDL
ncbi:MAG: hypothetical protein JRE23_11110 [Deltaproteobacteria bacterium]|nr:hypothetical protein [Deltaproteobacteria bacterium]